MFHLLYFSADDNGRILYLTGASSIIFQRRKRISERRGSFCPPNAWNGDWRRCWRRISPA